MFNFCFLQSEITIVHKVTFGPLVVK